MSKISVQNSRRSAVIAPEIRDNLPTQRQLDNLEIRFNNCVITYKLKHIETQATKCRQRKIGRSLGFNFRSLRILYANSDACLFTKCLFNPSDRGIVQEHIKNLETPVIRFSNCKFLRRDSLFSEKVVRSWRAHRGLVVKFSGKKGFVDIDKDVIRLKDLPSILEYIIVHGKDVFP